MHQFAFCESITAGSRSPWHLRKLTGAGKKLGGGVDTMSLCGRVKSPYGWDLDVKVTEGYLQHVCPACVEKYRKEMKDR